MMMTLLMMLMMMMMNMTLVMMMMMAMTGDDIALHITCLLASVFIIFMVTMVIMMKMTIVTIVMAMTAIAIGADDGDDGNDDDYIDLFQGRKVQSEAWRKRSNCDNSHFHKARWSCLYCQCFHRLVKLPILLIARKYHLTSSKYCKSLG